MINDPNSELNKIIDFKMTHEIIPEFDRIDRLKAANKGE